MRFSLAFFAAALASVVLAQDKPNAFNIPPAGYLLHAGEPTTFTWSNKQGSTVTLQLRDGSNGALNSGTNIASNIANSGSFTWQVPAGTVEGNSYTIEIINDDNTSETNFTPQFDILSPVKATPTGTNAATTSGATATGSNTASTTAASTTGSASTGSASTGTASSTGTSSSASASASTTATGSSTAASSVPTTNPAPVVKVGGSLLAVAIAFAVAL